MKRWKRKGQTTTATAGSPGRDGHHLLDQETGSYLKKWTGRRPVALLYPNSYQIGMSSLGLQLVYRLLNSRDDIVCERFFLPGAGEPLSSVESGRPLDNFPIVLISVSFEHDYVNIPAIFLAAGIEPLADLRSDEIAPGQPLVVAGGVATFINPEPLAPFVDLFAIGEAEVLVGDLLDTVSRCSGGREALLRLLNGDHDGFYAPRFYNPRYDQSGRFTGFVGQSGLPTRIIRRFLRATDCAGHSEVLTPRTEFADLYMTELGRGCSRGCRFCTAGFIFRPPRLWDTGAIISSLEQRPGSVNRVGLLGMEMTDAKTLRDVAGHLSDVGCSLSFSSLRADRISDELLSLLAVSGLKSVAIAPDGASQRLRGVINKGLHESDLIDAAERLVTAGIGKLKLYLMIGLPSETDEDLAEFIDLLGRIRSRIMPIGRERGRLCEMQLSVNCFVPKPWTPFQYHPFGVTESLANEQTVSDKVALALFKDKIVMLKQSVARMDNVRISFDHPEHALFQAVLARGDRRLAGVLLQMASSGISWKRAMKESDLTVNLFATRQYGPDSALPWSIIDHGIAESYLWGEYRRAWSAKSTAPCETRRCRRCGVCHD